MTVTLSLPRQLVLRWWLNCRWCNLPASSALTLLWIYWTREFQLAGSFRSSTILLAIIDKKEPIPSSWRNPSSKSSLPKSREEELDRTKNPLSDLKLPSICDFHDLLNPQTPIEDESALQFRWPDLWSGGSDWITISGTRVRWLAIVWTSSAQ